MWPGTTAFASPGRTVAPHQSLLKGAFSTGPREDTAVRDKHSRVAPLALGLGCGVHLWRRRRLKSGHRVVKRSGEAEDVSDLSDAPLCRVARGQSPLSGPRVPVWLFRQAGRHLPEYMEYKRAHRKNFLQLLQDPRDVAEVTLQPLRRYNVDAAILFSDILVVAQALGLCVEMPGSGITVKDPLECPEDLNRLPSLQEATREFVELRLGHVISAVGLIRERMIVEGFGTLPLIGFSAAPWTLFFYMVGGSSKRRLDAGQRWLVQQPLAAKKLLVLLSRVIVEYVSAQIDAGCHVVQIFEAMGDKISKEHFDEFALDHMQYIAEELGRRYPEVPLMVFPRGASHALPALQNCGYDVVTVDTAHDLGDAAKMLRASAGGRDIATLQGNFDPKWLRPSEGSAGRVRHEVQQMLDSAGNSRLIANLGEGLNGMESPELVKAFVDAVHEFSK